MPEQASFTAEMVALVRAREQRQPPERRVVDDPFASRFLELGGARLTGRGGVLEGVVDGIWKAPFVGFASAVLARHRIMDDLLLADTAAGATQCVILGAGYDARAYRFAPPKGPARTFEVDHPTLSSTKKEIVARALGGPPPHVRFVSVDFERERLDERLLAEGYDRAARTVFIWEGVTYYISEAAIRGTLASVHGLAAAGSSIVLDGWALASGLRGLVLRGRWLAMKAGVGAIGEPFRFAFASPGAAGAMLREEGYDVLFVHDAARLREVLRERGRTLLRVTGDVVVAAGRKR